MAHTRLLPIKALLAVSLALTMIGCGQRGELYLPERQPEPQQQEAPQGGESGQAAPAATDTPAEAN